MIDLEMAKLDPASIFKRPSDVLRETELSYAEKIDILKRWAYDERELSVAEEENMGSATNTDRRTILDEILKALIILGYNNEDAQNPPTKQGG